METLKIADIEESIIELRKFLYKMCQIKIGTKISKEFKTSKDLLQDCPLSPILFNGLRSVTKWV